MDFFKKAIKQLLFIFLIIMGYIVFYSAVSPLWEPSSNQVGTITEVEALGCNYCEKLKTLIDLFQKDQKLQIEQVKLLKEQIKLLKEQNKFLKEKR